MTSNRYSLWDEVELGNHVDLLTGYPFKSEKFTTSSDAMRLVKGSVVSQGFLDWDGAPGWPSSDIEAYQKFALEAGDVVLAMDRPWVEAGLKYAWIKAEDTPCLLVQRVARLRGFNGLDTTFLRYIIGSLDFSNYIAPIVTGVNVPHISPGQIRSFRFPLPPLQIQRKVAAILSAYDDLIDNNTRRIRLLEEMALRIYREWFVEFRYPGHENVPTVDSELGPIPQGWTVQTINEMADVTDYVANGSFASLKQHVRYRSEPNHAVLVRLKDYSNGWPSDRVYVDEAAYHFLRKSSLTPGDIVVANVGSVGTVFRVPDLGQPMTLGPNAVRVHPHEPDTKDYLFRFLASERGQSLIMGIVSGSAQPKFNKTNFRRLPVVLPPSPIRQKLASILSINYDSTENLYQLNVNLKTTRDLLLPRLISGEIDVSGLSIAIPRELE